MKACKLQPRSARRRLRLARALAAENGVLERGACWNQSAQGNLKTQQENMSKVHDDKSRVRNTIGSLQSEMDIDLHFVHTFYASIIYLHLKEGLARK